MKLRKIFLKQPPPSSPTPPPSPSPRPPSLPFLRRLLLFLLPFLLAALGGVFLLPRLLSPSPSPSPSPPPAPSLPSPGPPVVPSVPSAPLTPTAPPVPREEVGGKEEAQGFRDPFRNPLARKGKERPALSPPSPGGPPSLPLPPLPPSPLPPGPPPAAPKETPPPRPVLRCLAVSLAAKGVAIVEREGVQLVLETGESIPGVGKLVGVSQTGCTVKAHGRTYVYPLEEVNRD